MGHEKKTPMTLCNILNINITAIIDHFCLPWLESADRANTITRVQFET